MKKTFPFPIGTVHIVGIGGIGMSGYAEVLHHLGYAVQGSDQSESANVLRLRSLGIRVMIGHQPDNILNDKGALCAVVVRSTAVKDSNPEVVAARARHVPVIPRVELLAELMRSKWCINISGTHGKTTTTSMIGHVLEKAGIDPTVINGGIINAYGSNTRMGAGPWMVVESDESDGTFAKLPSVASVITNIDPEHLDHYGDFDSLKQAFVAYARNLPFFGVVICCGDHTVVQELMPQFERRTLTYGFDTGNDLRAVDVTTTPDGLLFNIEVNVTALPHFSKRIESVQLPMFGRHNILNTLAAFAAGHEAGIAADTIVQAMGKFAGVKRRFTTTGIVNGITVIDDYGHHPVEIAAVLKAGRDALMGRGQGRLLAVVQPHRYTRLHNLFDDFAACVQGADAVIVADVYAAGEEPIAGADRDHLLAAIRSKGLNTALPLQKPEDLPQMVADWAKPGDFVICLGAGSITQWAYALPKELENIFGVAPVKANGR